ncbi:MAG: ABC transporter ATP-binding protein [Hyphomicrobiales bacterium]|nr:ABC transporter ATP-binding protein [Hyphomicrobiales bacterium]PCJ89466.1 MAG: ABC transporter ATP-binding protein [Hyphomicrobiales bacterium]
MLLEVNELSSGYGASQVLFGVDLKIDAGQVVALMGRNGMGKSTTIRTICGLNKIWFGSINFNGAPLVSGQPHKNTALGLGLVPEGRRCFANLTVDENLRVAATKGPWNRKSVGELFPVLLERRRQMANTLSGGEQQMLAIGRALMTNPKLLLLDEATEGLAPVVRQQIWQAVADLKDKGQSILLVDKSLAEVSQVADQAVILEKGKSVWSGEFGGLTTELRDRYLGI